MCFSYAVPPHMSIFRSSSKKFNQRKEMYVFNMNQQNRPWKKISVASEKKSLEHWSCFCSQVQFSIWCYILKFTKGLNFERVQYCLISNASVFLENLCKPELVGGALFYMVSLPNFLFSNPPGLALFHIACKKFSIWSKNQILGFDPEIFLRIK